MPFHHAAVLLCRAGLIVIWLGLQTVRADDAPLTSARDVLNLSADEALLGHPVRVRGVVTYTNPTWAGQFFVQDDTGGVFVGHSGKSAPEVGQLVEVRGVSHPGAFAPFIEKPDWTVLGEVPLPAAREISMERFASGIDDGLRVEVTGRVRRAFSKSSDHWILIISSGGHRFEVTVTPAQPDMNLPALMGGVARPLARGSWRGLSTPPEGTGDGQVVRGISREVFVEQAEEINPYKRPCRSPAWANTGGTWPPANAPASEAWWSPGSAGKPWRSRMTAAD